MIYKVWHKYKIVPVQIRASMWFFVCSFFQKVISTITTPIFTRILTPKEYGLFSVFNSWYSILSIVVVLQLSLGMFTQGLVKFSEQKRKYASSMQGLALTLTALWTIVYWMFHNFWNQVFGLTTVQMLALLLMIWTSSVMNFWSAEQRVEYKYRNLVLVTLFVSIAKPTLGIFLVTHAEDKVTARILGLALVELIAYTGLFIRQMQRGKTFFDAYFWKRALMLNLPLVPHYLAQSVLSGADRIMIQKMVGDSAAGIYGLAYSVSLVMTMFNSALMQTIGPWTLQKIKSHRENEITRISYLSLLVIAVVNLALIALAPEVVSIFAPPAYYDAIWIIPPVAMSTIFTFSYDYFSNFSFYYEKTKFIAGASIVSAVLNIILNAIFIPIFGYYAAGYTTLVCYIAYAAAHYFCMRHVCHVYGHDANCFDWKILLLIYGSFMVCGLCLTGIYSYPAIRYGIIVLLFLGTLIFRKKLWELFCRIRSLQTEKQ